MLKARPAKEVVVRMPNAIGALDAIARTVADRGIDIFAVSSWVEGAQAVVRLVTEDSVRLLDALKAQRYEAREADVIVTDVPHKPGMLHRLTETLAEDEIDLQHLYATATAAQDRRPVGFTAANNDRAMVLLNRIAAGGGAGDAPSTTRTKSPGAA